MKDLLEIELREPGKTFVLNNDNFLDYFASDAVKEALNAVDRELGDEFSEHNST